MSMEDKVIQAIIKNSSSSRPTPSGSIDKIKADAGIDEESFDNVLESLENRGLIIRRYKNDRLSYLELSIDFQSN